MLTNIKENFQGIILSVAIALLAFLLSRYIPFFNEVILAFLLGVLINNLTKLPKSINAGVSFSSSKILEFAIIFMAFSINLKSIASRGFKTFLFVLVIVLLSLLATLFLAKRFKCPNTTAWLVGFGTAICGSSAIAAVAPTLSKNKEDMAVSIAVVNLLGSLAMVALPFALMLLPFSDEQNGFVLGASLQSVGNVAGAGAAISKDVNDIAVTVKLARVALLSPAVLFFSFLANKSQNSENNQGFSFSIPYYLWLFIAITIVFSFIPLPENVLDYIKEAGKFLLTVSMAAIGLKVSFSSLFQSGKKAIGFGVVIFLVQLVLSFGFMMLL